MAVSKPKSDSRQPRGLPILWRIVRLPFALPVFLFNEVRFSLCLRRLVAGGAEQAWPRLVDLWIRAEGFYAGPVGALTATAVEDVVIHRFLTAYPGSESVVRSTLTHPNPTVCAYSIQTLCRLKRLRGESTTLSDFPVSLFQREDTVLEHFHCFVWEKRLRDIVTERVASRKSG